MTHYSLLIKKQVIDALPSRTKKRFNVTGLLLMGVLIAAIIAAFVLIFSEFTKTYTAIRINRIPDIAARQFELMTMAYFVLLIICFLSGVNRLCYSLFENSDINILISMPFSAWDIFLSKLTWVYIKQVALSMLCVLPVNFTFFFTTGLVNAYNILMSFVVGLILPIIPLGVASIVALPFYYVKRAIGTRYLLSFVVTTALTAGFCVLYYFVFRFAENLLNAGKLASLFNEKVMGGIISFTSACYPANLLANIMLKRELGRSFGIVIGMLAAALLAGGLIIRAIFIRVTQYGLSERVPHILKKKLRFNRKPRMLSLIVKEFITVLRTPGYSFMYFTTAIIMPIMVFCAAKLSLSLFGTLIGNTRVAFEVCTFLTLLYSTLTNTFCSTAISRDGYMSMTVKALPYSPAQILGAKMIFGSMVSELGIVLSCVALGATGIESLADLAVTFVSATMLSVAQIALGTRLDLNHPHFSKVDDGEIKEANSTVSALIVVGFIVCFTMGILLLMNTVRGIIQGRVTETERWISYVYALAIPFALMVLSGIYFFVRLKRTYENLDAEGNK